MLTRESCPGCTSEKLSPMGGYRTKEAEIGITLCEGCGLVFVNPMFQDTDKERLQPDVRQLHRSRSAELNDAKALHRSRKRAARWEYVLRDLLPPRSRVLEVGAGDGALVELLLKHGHTPVALDPDAGACDYVSSRFGVRTIAARVEDADLESAGPFDAILMLNLIEHLEDPANVMRVLRGFLRDGGLVGIETPNILRTKVGPKRMYSFPHNYYFSPQSLLQMVSAQGYEPVQWREFPLDMFHLIVRKSNSSVGSNALDGSAHATRVRNAIHNHRWVYYARLQFLFRKIPRFREWYLYGRYEDRHFAH